MAAGPGGTIIGRLRVKVVPDTSQFREDLKRDLAAVNETEDVKIGVRLNQADIKAAQAALAAAFDNQTVLITPVVLPGAGGGGTPPGPPPGGGGPVTPSPSPGGGGDGDLPGPSEAELKKRALVIGGYTREIEAFFKKIGGPIAQGGAIVSLIAVIAASMSAIVGGVILLPGLVAAFLAPIGVLALTLGTFQQAFQNLSPAFALFGDQLNASVAPAAERLVEALNLLAPILQGSAQRLGAAFGTIVDAISAFIAGNVVEIQLLFTNLAIAMEALAPFIGVVLDLFLQFLNFILPFIPPFLEALTAGLQVMAAEFETIAPLIAVAISDFTTLFVGIIEALPAIIAILIIFGQNARLVFELVGTVVGSFYRAFESVMAGVRQVIGLVVQSFRDAGGGIAGTVQAIQTAVNGAIGIVVSVLLNLALVASDMTATVLAAIGKFIPGFSDMAAKVRQAVDEVRDRFEELPGQITSALDGIDLSAIGGRIIDGFIGGITSRFDDVQRVLGNLTAQIPDWKGPAAVDRKLLQGPADLIMEGFTDRIEANFGGVRATFGAVPIGLDVPAQRPGGLTQTFMVDPRADEGFVEAIATRAGQQASRALNQRYLRV